jgi:hypothetical protein
MKRLLPIACLVSACDDPLLDAQRIESTRVLGARVESAGDARRAWPEPGEVATVSWLVADPRPAPPLGWAFSVCVAAPTVRGMPECDAPPFAELASSVASSALPVFELTTPDVERVLVRGAICSDAQPLLAEPLEASSCAGELELVLLEVEVSRDGATNRNPALADATISFDGVAWPAPSEAMLARESCSKSDAEPALPIVSAGGGARQIAAALPADARDAGETLFVSHFSTAGRLERALSVIEPEQQALTIRVGWKPPKTGQLARFYFVARDLRGGVDWTRRTLCVVP